MSSNSLKVANVKLTLAEQVELGRRMTELGDNSARDALILNCVPVVIAAAKGFSNHSQASYDDLFQEGMMGVMEAIDKYDYRKNTKFSSFAYTRIIHKLALWVKNQMNFHPTSNGRGHISGIIMDSTIESFQSVFRTLPTDKQLAKLLSVPFEDVAYIKKHHANPVPPSHRLYLHASSELCARNAGMDVSTAVEKTLCSRYNRKHLLNAIQSMEPLDREIIYGRYLYEDKKVTLQELADAYGVNASTISRRERKALNYILRYFKENGIQPEF